MVTSSLLLSNQVYTIHRRLFINFALKIIIKSHNTRHYRTVSNFCNMIRSLRVPSGVPRCWSSHYGPDLNNPARAHSRSSQRIVRNTMQDIEDQPTCHWSIRDHHQRPIYLRMHVCVRVWLEKTRVYNTAESNMHDYHGQCIWPCFKGQSYTHHL